MARVEKQYGTSQANPEATLLSDKSLAEKAPVAIGYGSFFVTTYLAGGGRGQELKLLAEKLNPYDNTSENV